MAVDFGRVADTLLARAESLCAEWFPAGKRSGHEFKIGNLAGEPGDSLSVNLTTGRWADFAADIKGGDLTSLYAAMRGIDQGEAARSLCPEHCNGAGPDAARITRPADLPCQPIPDTDPPPHGKHGKPAYLYRYGSEFVIARYERDGDKTFCQWTYRGGRWTQKSRPQPRPIYNLKELSDRPDKSVLIVEGEKCVEAARSILPGYICVTWAGGAAAVKTADWSVLAGRDIVIWPDADKAGKEAAAALTAILIGDAQRLRVVNPEGQPDKWDIADAIADGWGEAELIEFARKHITEPSKQHTGRVHSGEPPIEIVAESALVTLQSLGLERNSGGVPHPHLSNVSLILQQHPEWQRRIWFDEFRCRVCFDDNQPWTDKQDRDLTAWLQQSMKFNKVTLALVHEAVCHAASTNTHHPLREWLGSLEHDGEPRLTDWIHDCLGVARSQFSENVSRCWPLAMVKRAFDPGCQMDNMPVLEGRMGRGKSSALAVLTGEWFASLPIAFGSKDFLQSIQGRWLIEVPDMTGFSKREHTQILATITTRDDSYRAPYARYTEDHPRVTIFAATSETDDYLQDVRGKRRYWPLRCQAIDLDAIASMRAQIFAEAVAEYRAGASHYFDQDAEADAEQAARVVEDPWQARVEHFCASRNEITMDDVLIGCLELRVDQQTRREVLRISAILRSIGWKQAVPKDAKGLSYRCWRRG